MRKILPVLLLGISIAGISDTGEFRPRRASDYKAKQTISQVTIAAEVYETDEMAKPLFGKNHPNKYGILPILIVIENHSSETISVTGMRVEYRYANGQSIPSTPPADIPYLRGANQPKVPVSGPIPGTGIPNISRKNPLNNPAIEARAFAARVIPPQDAAHGFFYFRCGHQRDSVLYITGLKQTATGQDLFFFEVPLPAPK